MNRLDNNDFKEMEQAIRGMISIFQYMSRCNIKFDGGNYCLMLTSLLMNWGKNEA